MIRISIRGKSTVCIRVVATGKLAATPRKGAQSKFFELRDRSQSIISCPIDKTVASLIYLPHEQLYTDGDTGYSRSPKTLLIPLTGPYLPLIKTKGFNIITPYYTLL